MEAYGGYTLQGCLDLTLPDLTTHLAKLGKTLTEPEWFVSAARKATTAKEKLLALRALAGE